MSNGREAFEASGCKDYDTWRIAWDAAMANQEPVAWRVICDRVMLFDDYKEAATYCAEGEFPEPLFAAPVVQPDDIRDAMRYRWLRAQHWGDSNLCVVKDPKDAVKLGRYCPSGGWLDAAIDDAMKERK